MARPHAECRVRAAFATCDSLPTRSQSMLLENLTPSTDDIRLSRSHSRSRRRRRSQLQVTVIVLLTLIDMAQCTERTVRTVGTSQRKRGRGTTSQAKDKLQFVSEAQSPSCFVSLSLSPSPSAFQCFLPAQK